MLCDDYYAYNIYEISHTDLRVNNFRLKKYKIPRLDDAFKQNLKVIQIIRYSFYSTIFNKQTHSKNRQKIKLKKIK